MTYSVYRLTIGPLATVQNKSIESEGSFDLKASTEIVPSLARGDVTEERASQGRFGKTILAGYYDNTARMGCM